MLNIYCRPDRVPVKILISEKFIGGEAHIFNICNDLIGGETWMRSAYGALTPAENLVTPAELLAPFSTGTRIYSGYAQGHRMFYWLQ